MEALLPAPDNLSILHSNTCSSLRDRTLSDLPASASSLPACTASVSLLWFVEREELIQGVLAQVAEQFSRYRILCMYFSGLWELSVAIVRLL